MIEVIAATLEDAIRIEKSGAGRIELVSALTEGGLTPSYALIEKVANSVHIPVNVMIRPHSRSFVYSKDEIEIMKKDIMIAKSLKVNGVVFGTLNSKNEICEEALKSLLDVCDGLDVTFHRAIEDVEDKVGAVKILAKYPLITNILTSGGSGNILKNIETIKNMIDNSKHINILLGGGLNFNNIEEIATKTKAPQYHFGTAVRVNNSLNGEIDEEKLKRMVSLLS